MQIPMQPLFYSLNIVSVYYEIIIQNASIFFIRIVIEFSSPILQEMSLIICDHYYFK